MTVSAVAAEPRPRSRRRRQLQGRRRRDPRRRGAGRPRQRQRPRSRRRDAGPPRHRRVRREPAAALRRLVPLHAVRRVRRAWTASRTSSSTERDSTSHRDGHDRRRPARPARRRRPLHDHEGQPVDRRCRPGVLAQRQRCATRPTCSPHRLDRAPFRGTVDVNPDGSFVYTPDPGFVGRRHVPLRRHQRSRARRRRRRLVTIDVTAPSARRCRPSATRARATEPGDRAGGRDGDDRAAERRDVAHWKVTARNLDAARPWCSRPGRAAARAAGHVRPDDARQRRVPDPDRGGVVGRRQGDGGVQRRRRRRHEARRLPDDVPRHGHHDRRHPRPGAPHLRHDRQATR